MEKIERVKMAPGKYALRREQDGAGDAGPLLISHLYNAEADKSEHFQNEIVMGCSVECGSISGRSYSAQDFWLTTPVTEILEVNEDQSVVRFKTGNSVYTVKSF